MGVRKILLNILSASDYLLVKVEIAAVIPYNGITSWQPGYRPASSETVL